jgi:hypothetical protein
VHDDTIQTTLRPLKENYHWGDGLIIEPPVHTFRCYVQNVNTMSTEGDWMQWKAATEEINSMNTGCFMFQEMNLDWTKERIAHVSHILRMSSSATTRQVSFCASTSDESTSTSIQRGGTAIGILDRWAGRVTEKGTDTSGLGRWSYQILTGRNGRRVVFVSAYRVCINNVNNAGAATVWMQQYRLLNLQGIDNPDPRQAFLDDLQLQVRLWREKEYEIFIGLDSNETILANRSKFRRFVENTSMIDLMRHRHGAREPPATHIKGSTTVDYGLGTPLLAEALQRSCFFRFYKGLIHSNHRGHSYDFDERILFGTTTNDMLDSAPRGIVSTNCIAVQFLSDCISEYCRENDLYQRAHDLFLKSPKDFQDSDHTELEELDHLFNIGLRKGDKKCQKLGTAPWSPKIHAGYLLFSYWHLKFSSIRTK